MTLQLGGDVSGYQMMLVYPHMPDALVWEEDGEDDEDEEDE